MLFVDAFNEKKRSFGSRHLYLRVTFVAPLCYIKSGIKPGRQRGMYQLHVKVRMHKSPPHFIEQNSQQG